MTTPVVGVDLGGTSIKAVLATNDGRVIARREIPTQSHAGPLIVLERIGELVREFGSMADAPIRAVGMGVPGLVEIESGTTMFLPNLPTQWRDIPVATILSSKLSMPVRILNDVRTATLGELTFGHGKGTTNLTMAFFSLGTGVGGGIVVDGRLRLGPMGAAGELGHQTILPEGPHCGCGNRGCLETLASGPALAAEGVRLALSGLAPKLREFVDGDAAKISPREMVIAAERGDTLVRQAIDRAAGYLGIAAANVAVILHPEIIVLGGGVAEIGALLIDRVREVIETRVGMFPPNDIRVVPSMLSDQAGVMGAVALATMAELPSKQI